MADGKVLLEVVVEGKNVKVVQREVEGVTDAVNENTTAQRRNKKAVNETAGAHEHYDRGLKGIHQTNLSGAKSFSKIRDVIGGSSGLVGAYATLAANLFAATAAFTALQKAAQVEQLTQGLSALGTASGLAMGTLAKGLQESTGYAISLQDAMRQVAMVTSAGFDTSVIQRLGAVATNTSIALGRDVQDSMNRLVKGATKLEPELLDELGIMVRLDEATQQYAKQMGKSASELTNFEKRQAFMNAVLAEGEKKFGAIGNSVDPNPYDKLSATIQELSTTILNFANILLGPLADALASSKMALLGVVLVISKGVINQALPYFSMLAQAASKAAQQYSASWSAASREAMANVNKARAEMAASDTKGLTKKQAITFSKLGTGTASIDEGAALQKSVEERIAKLQARKQAGWVAEKDATKSLSKQMVARYERELSLLTTKLGLIQSINVAETANVTAQAGSAVSKEASDFAKTIEEASNAFDEAGGIDALTAFGSGLKKVTLGGFEYIKGMTAASGSTTRFTGVLRLGAMSLTAFGATATAVGRVVSFAFKGLLAAIPYIGMIMLAIDLLTQAWNKISDAFKSDATKALEKSLDSTKTKFDELSTNSEEVNKSLEGTSQTITTFSQRAEAQANIVAQLSGSFNELASAQKKAGGDGKEFLSLIDEQIQKNKILKEAFSSEFSGLTSIEEVRQKNNGSYTKTIKLVEAFIKKQNSLANAQNALNKTIVESNSVFSEYLNSFINSTPTTKYAEALLQIQIAAKNSSIGIQGLASALSLLSEEQLKYLNLDPKKIASMKQDEEAYNKYNYYVGEAAGALEALNKIAAEPPSQAQVNFAGTPEAYNQYIKDLEKARNRVNSIFKSAGLPEISLDGPLADQRKQLIDNASYWQKAWKRAADALKGSLQDSSAAIDEAANSQLPLLNNQIKLDYSTQLLNKELDLLQEKYKHVGIISIQDTNNLVNLRKIAAKTQLDSLDAQIARTQQLVNTQKDAEGNKVEGQKLDQLKQQLAVLEQERRLRGEIFDQEFSALGTQKQNLETQIRGLESVTSELNNQLQIQQKLTAYAKETSEARMRIRESEAKLENLKAGGTGELSAQKQYDLQLQANKDRKAAIEQEKNAKIQTLALERDLIQKRFELSLVELAMIKANKDAFNELPPGLRKLVDDQLELYTNQDGTLKEAAKNIGGQVYAAGLEAANITARAEVVADEVTAAEKKKAAEIEANNAQVSLLNERLNAENTINDIYNRINSARSSILDNERRVRENELKAINLRNTGKYELTAQQTLDMEIEYASRRAALIKEEETRKLKIIDLEYKLLDAQTRVQQITLAETMKRLANQEKEKAAAAQNAGDTKAAEKFNANAKEIEDSAQKLDAEFTNLINKVIPEASRVAGEAVTAETNASLSDLGAGVLSALQNSLNSFNPVITATVETNIVEMGQSFDATGLVQATAGAASAIIQNTIVTAKSKLEELGGDAATGARAEALRTVIDLEDKIAAKRKQLNEMTPEDRAKAMKDTGAGSLSDLIAQQQKAAMSDPFTKMREGAAALQTIMAPVIASLKTLGPQGELVAAIAQGSVVMADSFTTLADSTKSAADKFAAVGAIVASVSAIVASAGNARIANIDREINAEKKRDGKSKESLARIASLEKKKETVAKKNFEMNKKMMMAQVVMSAAASIAGILGNESLKMGVLAVPLAFAVGGLALAQLAIIAGTSYEGGGGSGSGSATPGSISVGERRSTVDLAKSQSASGELSYMQGDKGTGGPENFRPAFIGSRAAGGRVNAGYMVGEQGPELFVPKVPGRIVPSDKINSAPAQNVNISITALDAAGVEEVLTKQRGNIIGMIREAANSYGEKFLETVDTSVYTQPSRGYSGVARA